MTEITDLVLPLLRKIQADIATLKDRLAQVNHRLDDIERRVERIERRLELREEAP